MARSASDMEIQIWIREQHGFVPHPAWIAHCKQLCGLPVQDVSLYQQSRFNECPEEKRIAIKQAFRYFRMLPEQE